MNKKNKKNKINKVNKTNKISKNKLIYYNGFIWIELLLAVIFLQGLLLMVGSYLLEQDRISILQMQRSVAMLRIDAMQVWSRASQQVEENRNKNSHLSSGPSSNSTSASSFWQVLWRNSNNSVLDSVSDDLFCAGASGDFNCNAKIYWTLPVSALSVKFPARVHWP